MIARTAHQIVVGGGRDCAAYYKARKEWVVFMWEVGMSQAEIAKEFGVNQSTISRWFKEGWKLVNAERIKEYSGGEGER